MRANRFVYILAVLVILSIAIFLAPFDYAFMLNRWRFNKAISRKPINIQELKTYIDNGFRSGYGHGRLYVAAVQKLIETEAEKGFDILFSEVKKKKRFPFVIGALTEYFFERDKTPKLEKQEELICIMIAFLQEPSTRVVAIHNLSRTGNEKAVIALEDLLNSGISLESGLKDKIRKAIAKIKQGEPIKNAL